MASRNTKFRNVIACEDVREEVGNKKSLMGVYGGDIIVSEIPAQIWLAFYIEKLPSEPGMAEELAVEIKQNEKIAGKVGIHVDPFETATLVLPRALVRFPE